MRFVVLCAPPPDDVSFERVYLVATVSCAAAASWCVHVWSVCTGEMVVGGVYFVAGFWYAESIFWFSLFVSRARARV